MQRPTSAAPPAVRYRSFRRFLLMMAAAAVAAVFAGGGLDAEREELDSYRNRIEERWEDLERDLRVRARLAGELPALLSGARPDLPERDLVNAGSRLSSSVKAFERARGRGAAVETGLAVDRALNRYLSLLGAVPASGGGSGHPASARLQATPGARRALDEIQAAEHRIAIRRTAYNEAIQQFNTRLALFPANLAARLFGFERYPYYLPTNIRDTIEFEQRPVAETAGGRNGGR